MRNWGRRGSVLTEFLLTLLIACLLIPACIVCIAILSGTLRFDQTLQDEIALMQLRRVLLLSYDIETNGNVVYFTYQTREMRLSDVNRNLIIQPGTQIFVSDIDYASFYYSQGLLMVKYEREGKTYEKALIGQ